MLCAFAHINTVQGLLHNDKRSNSSNSDGNSRNIKCTLVAQEVAALEGHVANPDDCNSTGDTAWFATKLVFTMDTLLLSRSKIALKEVARCRNWESLTTRLSPERVIRAVRLLAELFVLLKVVTVTPVGSRVYSQRNFRSDQKN